MSDNERDRQRFADNREPEWANCTECGQGRPKRVLDPRGVCPRCTLRVVKHAANPLFAPETTQHIDPEREIRGDTHG